MPTPKHTVAEMVESSVAKFGRKLCIVCAKKEVEKQNAAKTVSE